MPKKNILIIGATGFTGAYVLEEFLFRGTYNVSVLVRDRRKLLSFTDQIRVYDGDLDNSSSILAALNGQDILLNLASLGFGHAPGLVNACQQAGVRRAVFISTTGIFTKLSPDSKQIRLDAEALIRSSGLDYTIIRPTMIFGDTGDRNMIRLIRLIDRFPVIPVLGAGTYLQQPVYVGDLATAIFQAVDNKIAINKEYNVSGYEPLRYNQVIDIVSGLLGKKPLIIRIPFTLSKLVVAISEKLLPRPLIKVEQVLRLNEDKAFDHSAAKKELGYNPITFEKAIRIEISKYKEAQK